MGEVKRYYACHDVYGDIEMRECVYGDYVLHDDLAALQQKLDEETHSAEQNATYLEALTERMMAAEKERDALAGLLGQVVKIDGYDNGYCITEFEHNGLRPFSFCPEKVTDLYTAPPVAAPAINLAELVPEQSLNGQAPFLGDKEPYYNRGWNDCRVAILRKIEEAK